MSTARFTIRNLTTAAAWGAFDDAGFVAAARGGGGPTPPLPTGMDTRLTDTTSSMIGLLVNREGMNTTVKTTARCTPIASEEANHHRRSASCWRR